MDAGGRLSMRLRIVLAGICGSDLMRLNLGASYESLGHEIVGLDATGEQLYAVDPLFGCGRCEACTASGRRFCRDLQSPGKSLPGALGGGSIDVPQSHAYPIAGDAVAATLADPLACCLSALDKFEDDPLGQELLIVGDGTIGLLTAALAESRGMIPTLVVKEESRLRRWSRCVAFRALHSERIQSPSVVLAAGGSQAELLNAAIAATAQGGQLVCLGAFPSLVGDLDIATLLKREIRLEGVYGHEERHFAQAVQQLCGDFGAGLRHMIHVVSHETGLSEAFALAKQPEIVKVIVDFRGAATYR